MSQQQTVQAVVGAAALVVEYCLACRMAARGRRLSAADALIDGATIGLVGALGYFLLAGLPLVGFQRWHIASAALAPVVVALLALACSGVRDARIASVIRLAQDRDSASYLTLLHLLSRRRELLADAVRALATSLRTAQSGELAESLAALVSLWGAAGRTQVPDTGLPLRAVHEALGDPSQATRILAARVLTVAFSADSAAPLTAAFLAVRPRVVVGGDRPTPKAQDEHEAAAMLEALGICAAHGPCAGFDADRKIAEQWSSRLASLRTSYQELIEEYRSAVAEYNERVEELGEEDDDGPPALVDLRRLSPAAPGLTSPLEREQLRIRSLETRLRKMQHDLDDVVPAGLSSAYLVFSVFADAQRYSASVRQMAATGLRSMLSDPGLDDDSKTDIRGTLDTALDADEAEALRTREVRLVPGATPGQLAFELERASAWMATNVAESLDDADGAREDLPYLAYEVCARIPEATSFLAAYPLRLMAQRDQHARLGYLRLYGFRPEHWTEYTPPKDAGPVHRRYLRIDDFTVPNSMGLAFLLLRDARLAVPVLYHEFLHSRGRLNEAEVWLREQAFRRGMIAEMAPGRRRDIAQYHRSLVQTASSDDAGVDRVMLSADLTSEAFRQLLNHVILLLYGSQLTEQEARARAIQVIDECDEDTRRLNEGLTWCPEVPYPELVSEEADEQRKQVTRIVVRRATAPKELTPEAFAAIIREPEFQTQLAQWRKYLDRVVRGAGEGA